MVLIARKYTWLYHFGSCLGSGYFGGLTYRSSHLLNSNKLLFWSFAGTVETSEASGEASGLLT